MRSQDNTAPDPYAAWQQPATEAALQAFADGRDRFLVAAAPATGKTRYAIGTIQSFICVCHAPSRRAKLRTFSRLPGPVNGFESKCTKST